MRERARDARVIYVLFMIKHYISIQPVCASSLPSFEVCYRDVPSSVIFHTSLLWNEHSTP